LSGTQLLTNSIAYSSKSHGGGGADSYREQTQTNKYTHIHFLLVHSFIIVFRQRAWQTVSVLAHVGLIFSYRIAYGLTKEVALLSDHFIS